MTIAVWATMGQNVIARASLLRLAAVEDTVTMTESAFVYPDSQAQIVRIVKRDIMGQIVKHIVIRGQDVGDGEAVGQMEIAFAMKDLRVQIVSCALTGWLE